MSTEKNASNLKVEGYILLGEYFWDSKPGRAAQVTLRELLWRKQEEEPGYIEVLQQRVGSLNIERLLLIKENQMTQVKERS